MLLCIFHIIATIQSLIKTVRSKVPSGALSWVFSEQHLAVWLQLWENTADPEVAGGMELNCIVNTKDVAAPLCKLATIMLSVMF